VAAISAEVRAILLNKICKILQFLYRFVTSAHDSPFCAHWPFLHKIVHVQNDGILTSLCMCVCLQDMELINILYLQDIDLGIGREAFDDLCNDTAVTVVKDSECAQLKQV